MLRPGGYWINFGACVFVHACACGIHGFVFNAEVPMSVLLGIPVEALFPFALCSARDVGMLSLRAGPLLYHFDDNRDGPSIELSFAEVYA